MSWPIRMNRPHKTKPFYCCRRDFLWALRGPTLRTIPPIKGSRRDCIFESALVRYMHGSWRRCFTTALFISRRKRVLLTCFERRNLIEKPSFLEPLTVAGPARIEVVTQRHQDVVVPLGIHLGNMGCLELWHSSRKALRLHKLILPFHGLVSYSDVEVCGVGFFGRFSPLLFITIQA